VESELRRALARHADGVHRLEPPAAVFDAALPAALAAFYREHDGGDLFHESLSILPAAHVRRQHDRFHVGTIEADDLYVAPDGAVWRLEEDTGEWIEEGTAFDRFLLGWLDAQSVLVDAEGEFRDDVFDEEGELTDAAAARRERKALDRDRGAPGPRWRLARALARAGKIDAARAELEQVVEARPRFGWAWFDLARMAEQLGELDNAHADAVAAAEADPDYEHAPFFWAHAARIAATRGDEPARAAAAARALAGNPDLPRMHREAAAASLADEQAEQAREHAALAAALAPRDLQVIALREQIDRAAPPPPAADPPRPRRGTPRPRGGRRPGRSR
jgi:tetratricopeptide (TPR) repeat protein